MIACKPSDYERARNRGDYGEQDQRPVRYARKPPHGGKEGGQRQSDQNDTTANV
jgi:hypothetical protein